MTTMFDPALCYAQIQHAWEQQPNPAQFMRAKRLAERLDSWLEDDGTYPEGVDPDEVRRILDEILDKTEPL